MNVQESAKNFDSKVRESANFAVRGAKKLCTQTGPRVAGSDAEQEGQQIVLQTAERFADTREQESFSLRPNAVSGSASINSVLMLISTALAAVSGFVAQLPDLVHLVCRSAALALAALSFLVFLFALAGKSVFGGFTKKATSSNILCARKATGDVKRRIVFVGNIDSVLPRRFLKNSGSGKRSALLTLTGIAYVLCICIDASGWVLKSDLIPYQSYIFAGIQCAAFLRFALSLAWVDKKHPIDGANRNLTGAFTALSMLQYLDSNEIRFENTEVCAVVTGGREAGACGMKALEKAHKAEWNKTETVFIVFDTLADPEQLRICRFDAATAEFAQNAAKEMQMGTPFAKPLFGASDAKALHKGGQKVALLTASSPDGKDVYSQNDNAEALNLRAVEAAVRVGLCAMFRYDEV